MAASWTDDEVLGEVADRRDEHDADEEGGQSERGDERLDGADEDLGQDREEGGRPEQHDDRDAPAPRRAPVAGRLSVAAERPVGVRELIDERQGVRRDQRDGDQDRLLGDRALRLVAGGQGEDGRHEQADQRQDEQGGIGPGDLLAERLGAVAQAADQDARAHDQQQVADDRPGQRGLDDLDETGLQGEERDDQLGDVPERGIEDAADLRAGQGAQPLRRQAHDPRKAEDRGGRQHEQDGRVGVEAEVEDDRRRG